MKPWVTNTTRTILDHNAFLRVEQHEVELPDGTVIPDWAWIVTPSFVNVTAVTPAGQFLCFRQTKYAVKGTSLAPVGGYIDPGEDPLTAAKRELLEETGFASPDWTALGSYPCDSNRGCGTAHIFLAVNAQPVAAPDRDDLEEMELLELSRDELEAALTEGEVKTLPWVATYTLALRHLDHATAREAGKHKP